jgi:calmodulin
MDTLAINASQQELDLMIGEIDHNNDGEIQFEEFVDVMSRKVQATYTQDEVKNAFKIFEGTGATHQPGHIKLDALERALTSYGADKLNKAQVVELLQQIEVDGNGMFNYQEYINMMMSD